MAILLFALFPVATALSALVMLVALNLLLWTMIAYETRGYGGRATKCATATPSPEARPRSRPPRRVHRYRSDAAPRVPPMPPLPLGVTVAAGVDETSALVMVIAAAVAAVIVLASRHG